VALHDILKPFESILGPSRPCPFGNKVCGDDDPCAGHERWKHVKEVYTQFLHETTIHDVSTRHAGGTGSKKRKRR
jgi:DNA-binding IscR family transcriptional regulator